MYARDDTCCADVRGQMVGYITDELGPAAQERFLAHIEQCLDCREHLANMEEAAALSCQDLVELVTDYLEARLSPAERERFETHLALCEGCQTYVDQIRATIALAGRLTEQAIAPQAKAALLGAFRDWKRH